MMSLKLFPTAALYRHPVKTTLLLSSLAVVSFCTTSVNNNNASSSSSSSSFVVNNLGFIQNIHNHHQKEASIITASTKRSLTTSETTTTKASSNNSNNSNNVMVMVDTVYPGTAVQRLKVVHERIHQLVAQSALQRKSWDEIRKSILWAGGLHDLPNANPGQGYTGHSFNDFNHVDLTCMVDNVSNNENDGSVAGIALGNKLGNGIRVASIPELGPGGSWSTCAMGCDKDPPQDVAHIQFRSRIAFKLVWVPDEAFDTFVLVDDDGNLLAVGKPDTLEGGLPSIRERQMNYKLVVGSKYSKAADFLASNVSAE